MDAKHTGLLSKAPRRLLIKLVPPLVDVPRGMGTITVHKNSDLIAYKSDVRLLCGGMGSKLTVNCCSFSPRSFSLLKRSAYRIFSIDSR